MGMISFIPATDEQPAVEPQLEQQEKVVNKGGRPKKSPQATLETDKSELVKEN